MVPSAESTRGPLTTAQWTARFLAEPPRAAVLAVCAGVLGLRRAGALTHPQFWAEDGHFYERAYSVGWRSLALPYAGYVHALPRLIGMISVLFDPSAAPALFVGCAALLTLYVASRTLTGRCPFPRRAGAFALAVVLVPDTYEVLLNIVNLQWVLAAGLILLLISSDPVTRRQRVHDTVACVALGLTGPFSIILSPLFVWRAWSRRSRASAVLAAVTLACAAVEGYFLSTQPSSDPGTPGEHVALGLVLPAVARRIGGSLLLGSFLPGTTGPAVGTFLGLLTLGVVAYLSLRPGAIRQERLLIGSAFFAILAASLIRTRWSLHEYFTAHSNSRYVFVPQLIAAWLLFSLACEKGRPRKVAVALSAWALFVNIPRLREAAYPDMHWSLYVPKIRAGEAVTVPIDPPGWKMALPERTK